MNTIMSAVGESGGSAEMQAAVNQLKESYTNMVRIHVECGHQCVLLSLISVHASIFLMTENVSCSNFCGLFKFELKRKVSLKKEND